MYQVPYNKLFSNYTKYIMWYLLRNNLNKQDHKEDTIQLDRLQIISYHKKYTYRNSNRDKM